MGDVEDKKGMDGLSPKSSVKDTSGKNSPQVKGEHENSDNMPTTPANTTPNNGTPKSDQSEGTEGSKRIKSDSGEPDRKPAMRGSLTKMARRPPPLFSELPSATEESIKTFQVIESSIYTSKYLGDSGQDEIMSCDCRPSWDGDTNHACGEDSECINRLTSMECVGSACGCGDDCQNQRFQKRQYANVDVIKTEKKGYGIRINEDLAPGTFIYEYVGEVIDEAKFRRRTETYDKEGIKHFYFMSLGKSEFIDATRKGGLGRFCNHSCNPNCYVDKWVVGDKLRMGIFAKKKIKAGEELVFDYNVDRYGADPQACFCGEPNCIGYIGGKTQTEAGTKLSHQTLEALGLGDDDIDSWSTATARRKKPKKGEIDDDYIESAQPKALEASAVNGIMSSLVSCKEQWIVIKLLNRIHASEDPAVQGRVMRLHGYSIMNSLLGKWASEPNIVITILGVLNKWPRLTKNKITSSKIEGTVQEINKETLDEKIKQLCTELLNDWSSLQTAFRIPRRAPGSENVPEFTFDDGRRNREKSPTPPPRVPTPTKPRTLPIKRDFNPPRGPSNGGPNSHSIRGPLNQPPPPPPPIVPSGYIIPQSTNNSPLSKGWWWHRDQRGVKFFYTTDYSKVQWNHPMDPQVVPQLNPIGARKRGLEDIIQQCQEEYVEINEAKKRAEMEKRAQEEAEKQRKEEERRKYEEERRARKKKEHEARKLKKKQDEKFKSMDPEIAKRLIAKTHGLIAHEVANAHMKKYKWNWPKEDYKLLLKGFSYRLCEKTLEKGGKYAERPGIELDKDYKQKIAARVKAWMKDERYCKKKLAQFRVEFAPKSSAEQPGSSASVDSPAPRDSKGTPSTPKKSCDDDDYLDEDPKESLPSSQQDGGDTPMDGNFGEGPSSAKREREDTGEMSDRDGSTSPKRARSASPQRPSQIAVLTNSSQSLPQSPTITNLQIQPISGKDTPKRAREDDHEEPASAETTARVFKRPRSRSNSPNPPSDGFEVKEVIHHPQALRTGA